MSRYRFRSTDLRLGSPSPLPEPGPRPRRRAHHRRKPTLSRADQGAPSSVDSALRVLYVEDNPDDAYIISEIIRDDPARPVELDVAATLSDAMRTLQRSNPDVVLLDLSLPDAVGIDTVETVARAHPELPLVVLTGTDDEKLAVEAVHAGAQDYLVKSDLEARLLSRTLRHAIERQRLRLELKRAHAQAYHHATHDALTGLGNRQLLLGTLRQMLERADRYDDLLAVLFVDIDGFKTYNDACGHAEGDLLLKKIAEVLRAAVRKSDFVARLGGDEFVIVLQKISRTDNASHVARNILSQAKELRPARGEVDVSLSIGVALFPVDGDDEQAILRRADLAMYAVKRSGGGGVHFYSAAVEADDARRLALEVDLTTAARMKQLALRYQPVIDTDRRVVSGVEALVRWNHPRFGLVAPSEFIPIAEECGQIRALGNWILEEACRQLREWRDAGLPQLQLAVNVSQKQLSEDDLPERIENVLERNGIEPEALIIEVTESGIAKDMELATQILGQLKKLGITIFIDDFGTGYSSLVALRHLPVDGLKIDRSFVHALSARDKDSRLVEAILAMARKLHLTVVAEGVETSDELAFFSERRCSFVQGNFFSKPVAPESVSTVLCRPLEF